MLDPDPESVNTDPKHCLQTLVHCAVLRSLYFVEFIDNPDDGPFLYFTVLFCFCTSILYCTESRAQFIMPWQGRVQPCCPLRHS
jgi:hypothetical protein